VPVGARRQRAAPSGGNGSWGYVRLRLENYSESELKQWAQRLLATAWRDTHVYFMHEPTAPEYAKALMRFAGADR